MDIYDLIKDEERISFIGMCKNAGKTTVLNEVIKKLHKKQKNILLTSIGRDGEELDLVTNTKKPEVYIYKNDYIATAADLIKYCDITKEIVESTGIYTPLGEIIIIRALSDGFVQIAGPSISTQMSRVCESFKKHSSGKILIDGALERKSIATGKVSNVAILSSGASYSLDMEKTIRDTIYTSKLFSLPKFEIGLPEDFNREKYAKKYYIIEDGSLKKSEENIDLKEIWAKESDIDNIFVNGGLTDAMINPLLLSNAKLEGKRLVFFDGSRILIKYENFEKLKQRGLVFSCIDTINILAITINPFSAYGNHYDSGIFLEKMQKRTDLPVIDIANKYRR